MSLNRIVDPPVDDSSPQEGRWRQPVFWLLVFSSSLGLFLLTFSPLLAGAIPYVVAGGPAACTAIWLRMSDPWTARGKVGLYFHLAMAGFRAAASGLAAIVVSSVIAANLNRQPDFIQLVIALFVIMIGCGVSFVFGWIGTFIAIKNGVRVFVISNLYQVCRGDFSRIASLPKHKYVQNPANYVMAIAIAVPMLACWTILVVLTLPTNGDTRFLWIPIFLVCSLPVLAAACIVMLIRLSSRIIARTPFECWGAQMPEQMSVSTNWYYQS